MPKTLNKKHICHACRLHFEGDTLTDIAILLEVNPATLSRWRKTNIWIDYENELLEQFKSTSDSLTVDASDEKH